MPIEPHAVIFDYGNVLSGPQAPEAHRTVTGGLHTAEEFLTTAGAASLCASSSKAHRARARAAMQNRNSRDMGGVGRAPLCASSLEDIRAMAGVLNVSVEEFVPVSWSHRLAYDKAQLTPPAYWDAVARDCSRVLSRAQIEMLIELDNRSWSHPNPVMPAWAREIRAAGVRTAILSNMPAPMRAHLDCCCQWLPEFDQRTFSCDVGAAKPMPEIYAHCLAGLKVAPAQALFLDDRDENVRAAQAHRARAHAATQNRNSRDMGGVGRAPLCARSLEAHRARARAATQNRNFRDMGGVGRAPLCASSLEEFGIHSILFTDAAEAACELANRYSLPVPLQS